MKKIQSLFISVITLVFFLYLMVDHIETLKGTSDLKHFSIYNWGDYIDPLLLKKFEREYGYKVNYDTFDSNESMFMKIKQGGTSYDIVIPSDYTIQQLVQNNLLKKIDHKKLLGLENIDKNFLDLSFDPKNKFSIPYFWGTLGIVYNDKIIPKGKINSWNDLWSSKLKNKVMLVDGAREIVGLGLNSLGYSLNSKNKNELEKTINKLKKLRPNVKAIVADGIKMYMKNEESAVAVTYSGEAINMMEHNKHIQYIIPKEGSNLWFDNIVIPKNTKNEKAAYDFINFILKPENAAKNAEYIGYSTPNYKAKKFLSKKTNENKQLYPDNLVKKNLEIYKNLGSEYLNIYNELFLEFKMH